MTLSGELTARDLPIFCQDVPQPIRVADRREPPPMLSAAAARTRGLNTSQLTIAVVAALVAVVAFGLARDGSRSVASAALQDTGGIGALRWGDSYAKGSGYDRYAYVDVGVGDAAAAGALNAKSLVYMSGTSVRPPGSSYWTGVMYDDALANGWLLKDASGSYVMNKQYGAYVGDFGNPAYQQRWVDNVSAFLTKNGDDGVHIDDVIADAPGLTGGVYPTKYPSQQAWEDAQVAFIAYVGKAMRAKGFYVLVEANGRKFNASGVANDSGQTTIDFFSRLAPNVDGLMSEYWMETPQDEVNPTVRAAGGLDWDRHWEGWLSVMENVQSWGKEFFTLMYGSSSTAAGVNAMRYGKASFLLSWNGGGGAVMFKPDGGTTDPWNLEWTMPIGTPQGSKYQVGVGWRRDYTNGTALVNPDASSSQTFSLGGTYVKPDGSSVSSLTLGPMQAMVLRSTGTPAVTAPTNVSVPVLSGSAAVGSSLAATQGTWSGTPTSYGYQWQRCDGSGSFCSNISGATGASYTAVSADAGGTLRAAVTASNSSGSATAKSLPSAPVTTPAPAAPTNMSAPVVSGSAGVGAPLTSTAGTWSGAPTSYAYQWQRCDASGGLCAPISGATASSYTAVSADAGSTLRSKVTASNAGGSTSANSQQTAAVTPASSPVSAISVASSIAGGATISGSLAWTATLSGATSARVDFVIDGSVRSTDTTAPYRFNGDSGVLDTTTLSNGSHTLQVKGSTSDGRTATAGGTVTVSNTSSPPPPPPPPPASIVVTSSIANGATISGSLPWTSTVSGGTAAEVAFLIDGTVRWTEKTDPYWFNGNNKLFDTTTLANGSHTLQVRATMTDGRTASLQAIVTVANTTTPPPPPPPSAPAPTPLTVTSSVLDGTKLTDVVKWEATVKGGTASRVEFWIDGRLLWTEQAAPYVCNGDDKLLDANALGNGRHDFVVKAYASDGTVAMATVRVNVVK